MLVSEYRTLIEQIANIIIPDSNPIIPNMSFYKKGYIRGMLDLLLNIPLNERENIINKLYQEIHNETI